MRLIKAAPECQQQQQKRFALSGWRKKVSLVYRRVFTFRPKGDLGYLKRKLNYFCKMPPEKLHILYN